jgi:hypothetical protein
MGKERSPNLLSTCPGRRDYWLEETVGVKTNDLFRVFANNWLEDMLACIGVIYERISL